ncbi:chromate efflux transporter [Arcticibacterium luteifluviistationis]|uniref:Chromate transporter n=1 Tax=Arcticibacterium luteifluviistationis TaxID=1784714 RepID=A0A2Z4GFZ5_9BACT|nr:chromate efflux transporter [Arcticibacterium luteifluviistationis]AWW00092.1 chromate transporter [Arcticibacterium luteifluviistationis]
MRKIRYFIFLRDVLTIALTGFGGPNVHLTLFIKYFVIRHKYLSEAELMELQALCQILPGPTSTQTLTAIGFKLGGPVLAIITLFVWILPATIIMAGAALGVSFIDKDLLLKMTRFIKPMGIAFIFYAAYVIGRKVIHSKTSWVLMVLGAGMAFLYRSPYITPALILLGGIVASFKFEEQEILDKSPIKIAWRNFILWAVIFGASITVGSITQNLPIRLFENFYRNGSLAFGGGHIMKPLLFNEFVEFKHYLSADEFLSGIAIAELVPGPTFSIASFVGSLSMRDWGVSGQILGAGVAAIGIFLPGILMIFFVIRFWNQLKQYRAVRASLEGINASSTGLTIAAGISLFETMSGDMMSVWTIIITFLVLITTKVPSYVIIMGGLFLGLVINY